MSFEISEHDEQHLPMSITKFGHDVSIMADVKIPCEFADIFSADISVSSVYISGARINGTRSLGKSRAN